MSKSDKNKARRKRKRHLDELEKASRTPGILKLAQGIPYPAKTEISGITALARSIPYLP